MDGEITMEGNQTGPEHYYWSVEEAAKACKCSTSTIYGWIRRRLIPFSQPGGRNGKILIPRDAVERIMNLPGSHPVQVPTTARRGRAIDWMRE
jgi:excisionase family DNA binding protein